MEKNRKKSSALLPELVTMEKTEEKIAIRLPEPLFLSVKCNTLKTRGCSFGVD